MDFKTLLKGQQVFGEEEKNYVVSGITKNSKKTKAGDVFFDLSHTYENGYKNSEEAIKKGAVAVVSNHKFPFENAFYVRDVHSTFAQAAANYYGNAADGLKFVGITGTNGKSTCAHLITQALRFCGKKVAIIGTMGVDYGNKYEDLDMTTPDADDLQRVFAEAKRRGCEYVVMEVSAHGIDQKRIYGIKFDVSVLTNITQDHLDYFGTFERYRDCKLSFLMPDYTKCAVVCSDDESCRRFIDEAVVPTITYGIHNPADVFAINIKDDMSKAKFVCNIIDDVYNIECNLVGEYNILNVLASLSACSLLGLDIESVIESLKYTSPVEGRFNVFKVDGKYVVIDFAHTPDGLEKVLSTAKTFTKKRLCCVFGCGGNRDKDKRHKMGSIAEKYCDEVCLTNDNPRFEEPLAIVKGIEDGMQREHTVVLDREMAIRRAIKNARAGDVVVVAGKGGEKYQIFGNTKQKYSDIEVVKKIQAEEKKNKLTEKRKLLKKREVKNDSSI